MDTRAILTILIQGIAITLAIRGVVIEFKTQHRDPRGMLYPIIAVVISYTWTFISLLIRAMNSSQ